MSFVSTQETYIAVAAIDIAVAIAILLFVSDVFHIFSITFLNFLLRLVFAIHLLVS